MSTALVRRRHPRPQGRRAPRDADRLRLPDRPRARRRAGWTSCSWATASARWSSGYDTTRAVSLGMMAHHVRAVRNGVAPTPTSAPTCPPAPTGRPRRRVASARAARGRRRRLGEARGRPGRAGGGDHRRRHPGHGPRGPAPPDGDRLPARGDDPRRGRPHRRRGARPRRRRLLRGGHRGRAGRARRAHHRRGRLPDDRHRGRAGVRRPGAGLHRPHRPGARTRPAS